MIPVSTLVWFVVTLLMMAFFAGIEMAFYSINRFVVELRRKQGKTGAEIIGRFIEKPEAFLSVTLIGFTIFLVSFALVFNAVTWYLWNLLGLRNEIVRLILDIILAAFL